MAGFRRPDLFTVVHEIFQTDTADYADILLPATTQLEQFDLHRSYGHLYLVVNNPAIDPLGESKPNSEVFRLLADRMGFTEDCFRDSDEELAAHAITSEHPSMQGLSLSQLKESGWQRLNIPGDIRSILLGETFPRHLESVNFMQRATRSDGIGSIALRYIPPAESVQTAPEQASMYPLAMISPPAHNFMNSSFANLPSFLKLEKEPYLENASGMMPACAESKNRDLVRIYKRSRILHA